MTQQGWIDSVNHCCCNTSRILPLRMSAIFFTLMRPKRSRDGGFWSRTIFTPGLYPASAQLSQLAVAEMSTTLPVHGSSTHGATVYEVSSPSPMQRSFEDAQANVLSVAARQTGCKWPSLDVRIPPTSCEPSSSRPMQRSQRQCRLTSSFRSLSAGYIPRNSLTAIACSLYGVVCLLLWLRKLQKSSEPPCDRELMLLLHQNGGGTASINGCSR